MAQITSCTSLQLMLFLVSHLLGSIARHPYVQSHICCILSSFSFKHHKQELVIFMCCLFKKLKHAYACLKTMFQKFMFFSYYNNPNCCQLNAHLYLWFFEHLKWFKEACDLWLVAGFADTWEAWFSSEQTHKDQHTEFYKCRAIPGQCASSSTIETENSKLSSCHY